MSKKDNFPRANREIKATQVRLVAEDGEMVGIVPLVEALRRAEVARLDLVEISPGAEPPVCKILDFGKYKYDIKKRLQDSRKKQKVTLLKEVKFRPNIGQNDFDVKMRSIEKFLNEGDKVKVSLWFRGREMSHAEIGRQVFDRILEAIGENAKLELAPKMEGKQIMMILVPKTAVV